MSATLRFAPSPNGRLHLGHAYSALLNDRIARALGGRWLLRVEDIDPVRATPERVAGIAHDLRWLGLDWPLPVRRQSGHLGEYRSAADRLKRLRLVYPCFCSRGEVAQAVLAAESRTGNPVGRDPDGSPLYPGTCRRLPARVAAAQIAAGKPHCWRFDSSAAIERSGRPAWLCFEPDGREWSVPARPELWGDVVLLRRDVPASYHLCVVHDDNAQGITHVVRGRDLLAATDLHALLARCLDLPLPRYHHHALLLGPDGRKLAKSRGSESLASLRDAGVTADAIRVQLGFA